MRCTAQSKQSGQQCKKDAIPGFDVCHIHGGKTPSGMASPHHKGKGRSKHIPPELLDAYREAQSDEELLSIRDDVATTELLLQSSLSRWKHRESGKSWGLIKKAIDDLQKAFTNDNLGSVQVAIQAMRDVVDENVAHFAAEQEIRDNLELIQKLKQGEMKRLTTMQQMVTTEQAMLLVSALLDAVRRNVNDSGTLNAIQSEFVRLTTQPDRERIGTRNVEAD